MCKLFPFIALLAFHSAIFPFEELFDGKYHVTAGYRACIACHVYRANNDCIFACANPCIPSAIAIVNFPKTLTAGQQVNAALQLTGMGPLQKANSMLVDGPTGLNIESVGWRVVSDPAGGTANFVLQLAGQNSPVYQLEAPRVPGTYVLEAALHGSGCFAPFKSIYIRYDYDTVTVNAAAETSPPSIVAAAAAQARAAWVLFSEPVQPAEARLAANYQVTQAGGGSLRVDSVSLSLDRKTATVYTAGAFAHGQSYTVTVNNLKDYAITPNKIAANASKSFTAARLPAVSLFPDIGMDGKNGAIRMLRPQLHLLGRGSASGEIFRANQRWDLSGFPPGENIQSAILEMRQVEPDSVVFKGGPVAWEAYRLNDTALGHWILDYPNSSWYWNGLSPGSTPVATLNQRVDSLAAGANPVVWKWDVTNDFRQAYQQGRKFYALRLKLANESGAVPGVRLYSGMYVDTAKLPRLVVTLDPSTAGVEQPFSPTADARILTASPNPFRVNTVIFFPDWKPGAALSIFESSGRFVKRAAFGSSGIVRWKALDAEGRPLAPGIYLARIAMGSHESFLRLAIIH